MTKQTPDDIWEQHKAEYLLRPYPVGLFECGLATGLLILSQWIRDNEKPSASINRIQLEINTLIYDSTGTIKRIEDLCTHKSHS